MKVIKVFNRNSRYHEPDEHEHIFIVRDIDANEKVSRIESGEFGEYTDYVVEDHDGKWRNNLEKKFDEITEKIIEKWCQDQGKCEHYYLRLPVGHAERSDYNDAVVNIISSRRDIKKQLKLKD